MTFQEFITSLFENSQTFRRIVFKEKVLSITDTDIQAFWNSLLNFLQNQISQEKSTLLRTDFANNSFFDYYSKDNSSIGQTTCDLDVNDITELNNYWNKSIQDMIDYFNQHFNSEESTENMLDASVITNGHIPNSLGSSFNSHDITGADAGYLFGDIAGDILVDFVKPWYNIQLNSYYAVRTDSVHHQTNSDRIDKKAVQTEDNLTFTRNQQVVNSEALEEYIRLIMPNNSRRVSVEDLNRNFWVISSVLQAITTYLFDEDGPIPFMFKNILNELVQLWENIMYLWAAFSLISQNEASDMRVIVMPMPLNEYNCYLKYDNFTQYPATAAEILKRLEFLTKKYSHSNLCIIVYTKQDNYFYNYYSSQTYRGIAFYNAKTKNFSYVPLVYKIEGDNNDYSIYFQPSSYQDYLFAMRETDTYYKWSFPLRNIPNVQEDPSDIYPKNFYGALRIIPELDFCVNSEGELQISNLKFTAIDAMKKAIYNEDTMIVEYYATEDITENSVKGIFSMNEISGEPALGNLDIYETTVSQAYYLGEIPSFSRRSAAGNRYAYSSSEEVKSDGKLIKIGNYLPSKFSDNEGNSNTKYYEDSDYYGLQKNPEGGNTDYLLNYTITGPGQDEDHAVSNIYGGLGSYNQVPSSKCTLYIPILDNNAIRLREGGVPSSMDETSYKNLGIDIITNYIKFKEQPSNITYYIAAVGISPWHNTPRDSGFQGYWPTNMLTHAFRYVPNKYKKYLTDTEIASSIQVKNKNDVTIGLLECLCKIDKKEAIFLVNAHQAFENNNGTWRLPQLYPETTIGSYWAYIDRIEKQTYFIDKNELINDGYQGTPTHDNVETALNDNNNVNHSIVINNLKTESDLRNTLAIPSGHWAVFDGHSDVGYNSNEKIYTSDPDRREVGYAHVQFSRQNGAEISGEYGRQMTTNNFSLMNQGTILPNSGASNMVYSWP